MVFYIFRYQILISKYDNFDPYVLFLFIMGKQLVSHHLQSSVSDFISLGKPFMNIKNNITDH